jgi:gluconolactonase
MEINKTTAPILFLCIILLSAFTGSALCAGMNSGLVSPGAVLKTVQSGFNGTEGPATDPDGNVYFTSRSVQGILKWSWSDGKVSSYRENVGEPVGMAFDAEGRLVVCEMGNGRLTRDDLKGNITVLADSYNGNKLRPNDVWVDPKGGIYFSSGQIYYLAPDGKKVNCVTADIGNANGVTGTPDGKTIYIGDTKVVYAFKIQPDGSLTDKTFFCNMEFSDGLKVDEKNNIYVTGDLLYIFSPKGEKIEEIAVPERPKNMNFAGRDRKTLFITCPNAAYTLEMTVSGVSAVIDRKTGNN